MADVEDSVHVLINLASRWPGALGRTLSHYETQAYAEAFKNIRRGGSFAKDVGRIVQTALRFYNYGFMKKTLNQCSEDDRLLHEHSHLICDAITYYGASDPDEAREDNDSPVREQRDLEEALGVLMSHGARPDTRTVDGKSPLYFTMKRGFDMAFVRLLEAGASPMETYSSPQGTISLLQLAGQRLEEVQTTWDYANIYRLGDQMSRQWPRMIIHLLTLDQPPQLPDRDMHDFFIAACRSCSVEEIERLLDVLHPDLQRAVQYEKGGEETLTALHAAAQAFRQDVIHMLLRAGAVPHACAGVYPLEYMVLHNIYWYYNKKDWFEISDILLEVAYNETDAKAMMPSLLEAKQVARIAQLLRRGYKPPLVPLCVDAEIIEMLVAHGSEINVANFMDLAIGRNQDRLTKQSPSPALFQYLQSKEWANFDRRYFGEVACYLMASASDEGMEILEQLMTGFGYDVNSTFPFFLEDRSDRPKSSFQSDDIRDFQWLDAMAICAESGQQTNLLQLACMHKWTNAARTLLSNGAKIQCPGLQQSAIELVIQRDLAGKWGTHERWTVRGENLIGVLLRYNDDVAQLSQVIDDRIARIKTFDQQEDFEDLLQSGDDLALDLLLDKIQDRCGIQLPEDCASTDAPDLPMRHSLEELLGVASHDEDVPRLALPSRPICGLDRLSYALLPLHGSRSIRLLELAPARNLSDPIVCTINTVSLNDHPSYEALSYVWGDASLKVGIEVNGAWFGATRNLVNALQRIRIIDTARTLWVDAICINQSDHDEKAHQIGLMRDIYMSASRTLMYIGETSDKLDQIFTSQLDINASGYLHEWKRDSDDGHGHLVEGWSHADSEAEVEFLSLSRRPYFLRTWTIQEHTLGRKPTIVCGPYQCKFASFVEVARRIEQGEKDGLPVSPQLLACASINDVQLSRPRGQPIITALEASRYASATDPKDKVFGILGLCDEQLIPIDYSWTVEHIYTEFAKSVIQQTKSLDLWSRLSWSPNPELPSWVPDWSVTRHIRMKERKRYDPRDNEPPVLLRGLRFDDNLLILHGKRTDVISEIGRGLLLSDEEAYGRKASSTFRETFQDWEYMVAQLAVKRGVRAIRGFSTVLLGRYEEAHESERAILDDVNVVLDRKYGSGALRKIFPRAFREAEVMPAFWSSSKGCSREWLDEKNGEYAPTIVDTCRNRRLFVTGKGLLGLAPIGVVSTDIIISLPGGPGAVIVRPTGQNHVKLVGECILERDDTERLFSEHSKVPWEEFVFE